MSTHIICFRGEIMILLYGYAFSWKNDKKKMLCGYPNISEYLMKGVWRVLETQQHMAHNVHPWLSHRRVL